MIHDLGSGALRDTSAFGLAHEPTVAESLHDGAAVALFSGDKLLGGPQAGVIAGRRDLVALIAHHPLARAVRADKATLAGVAATLRHYLLGEETTAIPIWRMIAASEPELRARADALRAALAGAGIVADVIPARSTVGGGSLPEETLPTAALAFAAAGLAPTRPDAGHLRRALTHRRPCHHRAHRREALLLDPRTIFPDDDPALLAGLRAALAR